MVIVELPGHGLSNSAAARSKHWIKRLERVDPAKSDGYAFEGVFAKFGATVEVAEGTWYLAYIEDVAGSGRLRGRRVALYRVTAEGVDEVKHWGLDSRPGWALKVRDEIAGILAASVAQDAEGGLPEDELHDTLGMPCWIAGRVLELDPGETGTWEEGPDTWTVERLPSGSLEVQKTTRYHVVLRGSGEPGQDGQ
jgi:hypothetical protein